MYRSRAVGALELTLSFEPTWQADSIAQPSLPAEWPAHYTDSVED